MQKGSMAEKKKVYWDGEEIPGLVSCADIPLIKNLIDVPGFRNVRQISSDITRVPVIEMEYETARDTKTLKFFSDFYLKSEIHQCVIVRTDAHGVEFDNLILPDCECVIETIPGYDSAAPKFASLKVSFIPSEIPIPVAV